ncbi:eukaryotic translation initiation factor 3 subunit F [Elysia marginata]|uniref:Eukaryotic translation initiation factor 3 subunit F n=1 Tax=Elysia marginata TaxID=1093978 RepID=A0AAV4HRS3_9GAST|nr:eukaryotic translation initiation factor 3 subunit F [Elysia marginata]
MSVKEVMGNGEWLLPQKNAKDPSCGNKATLLQQGCWSPARRTFRISKTEKKTNEEVLRLAATDRSLLRLIRKRQIREFFGHINRHESLEKLMLLGKVEGRRARGRQRQTSMDSLPRFINTSNKSLDIFRRTEDREAWKSPIVDVCARPDA